MQELSSSFCVLLSVSLGNRSLVYAALSSFWRDMATQEAVGDERDWIEDLAAIEYRYIATATQSVMSH